MQRQTGTVSAGTDAQESIKMVVGDRNGNADTCEWLHIIDVHPHKTAASSSKQAASQGRLLKG